MYDSIVCFCSQTSQMYVKLNTIQFFCTKISNISFTRRFFLGIILIVVIFEKLFENYVIL